MHGGNGQRQGRDAGFAAQRAQGFTLIELLVTIGIAAILLTLAVPSFTSLINANRLTAQANEVVASLQLARSEAVRRNTRVIVCRSTDGSTCITASGQGQWLTFVDANGNGTAQAGEILRNSVVKAPVRVSNTVDRVTFRPDGMARNGAGAGTLVTTTINVCMPVTQPAMNQRRVSIGTGGRVSTEPFNGGGLCP